MNKNKTNAVLLIALAVLAVVFFATDFLRKRQREQQYPSELAAIDTAAVSAITLRNAGQAGHEILLQKQNGHWQATQNGFTTRADTRALQQILNPLVSLKPQRLAAREPGQWSAYGVTDSLATRLIVDTESGETLDIYVGRLSMPQQSAPRTPYGRNPAAGSTTYVRLAQTDEVYAIPGMWGITLTRGFSAWRDATLAKLPKAKVQELRLQYPADSGFVLTRPDSLWLLNGQPAKEGAVNELLNTLRNSETRQFADEFQPNKAADYQLLASGKDMNALRLQAWIADDQQVFVHSNRNPDTYFKLPINGLGGSLFPPKDSFLTE